MKELLGKNLQEQYAQQKPFPHIILDNFLDEKRFSTFANQLFEQQFHEKYADLFHFYQTSDLKTLMPEFFAFVRDELRPFVEELAGLKLSSEKIDTQGAIYADGNYLLCHDDQLDSRAVAFMIYLTDVTAGGELLLYASKDGEPDAEKVTTVQPKENRFACFTVSKDSFHEVAEVLEDTQRVTLGGWFHHAE